jgi:hypothetical protein
MMMMMVMRLCVSTPLESATSILHCSMLR